MTTLSNLHIKKENVLLYQQVIFLILDVVNKKSDAQYFSVPDLPVRNVISQVTQCSAIQVFNENLQETRRSISEPNLDEDQRILPDQDLVSVRNEEMFNLFFSS